MMTMSMDPSSMNRMLMQSGGGGGGGASMYHHQSPGLGRRSLDRQRYYEYFGKGWAGDV